MMVPIRSVLAVCAILAASSASAQTALKWPPPGRSDPTRMPGDITTPPVGETLAPDDAKPVADRHLPPPDTTPAIPMELALEAAQAIVASCKAQGFLVAAAITDSAGVLRVGLSADGASPPGRLFGSMPKAVAAIAFKEPTSAIRTQLRANPSRVSEVQPNMLILPGGLPIITDGKMLGAIGVSGASADQDEICAHVGLEKIRSGLK